MAELRRKRRTRQDAAHVNCNCHKLAERRSRFAIFDVVLDGHGSNSITTSAYQGRLAQLADDFQRGRGEVVAAAADLSAFLEGTRDHFVKHGSVPKSDK